MKIDFEPEGELTAKKSYHYICLSLAVILPAALIIITLVKKTFSPFTLICCAAAAAVMLGIDYSNRSNRVVWDDERLALLGIFGVSKEYQWNQLSAVYSGSGMMRLEFSNKTKLYINPEYDGIDEFMKKIDAVRGQNGM